MGFFEGFSEVFRMPNNWYEAFAYAYFIFQYFLITKYIEMYNEAKKRRDSGKGFTEFIDR